MAPSVSVVMRTKDVTWVVDRALAGLFSQRRQDFELVVVDSGSRDATLDLVAKYPCRLIQIPAERYYPGAVLNDAIATVTSDIVVFQNSDVVPLDAYALERLLAPFDDPAVAATFARQVPRPEAHTWVRRDYETAFPERGEPPPWMTYSLPFAAMRRSVWQTRGFYGDAWGSEDTEWGDWAREHGHVVKYVPDAVVMHSHNYTLKQLWGRRFIEGEADAFIAKDDSSPLRAVRRFVGSLVHDVKSHVAAGDYAGLVQAPARRAVFHLAHLRGHQLGQARRESGSTDVSIGQRAVLSRY
jgi:rhamnosyltransferase